MTMDIRGIDWGNGPDQTRVRFTKVNVCGYEFPICIDMTIPDDTLYLISYDAKGEIMSKVKLDVCGKITEEFQRYIPKKAQDESSE